METDERREIDALPSRPIRFKTEVAPESKVGVQKLENALIMGHPFSVAIVSQTLQGTENGAETISQLWEYQPDLQIIFCVPKDADPDEISARFEFPKQMLVLEEPVTSIEIRQAARMLSLKWDQFSEFCYRLQELNRVLDQRALKLQATNRRLEREITERRVAESRFASAFRLSTVAMAVLSVDDGRVLDANESLFELLDTTSQALLGQTLKKFQSLDDAVSWAVARSLLPRSSKVASGAFHKLSVNELDYQCQRAQKAGRA